MLGSLTSLTGGGGLSASSSASNEQHAKNDISSGTITVGGLNMAPKAAIDGDSLVKLGVGALFVGGVIWGIKKFS